MTDFNDYDHPRATTSGRFTDKGNSAPEAEFSFYGTLTAEMERQSTAELLETYEALDAIEDIILDDPEFTGGHRDALILALAHANIKAEDPALVTPSPAAPLSADEKLVELVRLLDGGASPLAVIQFHSALTSDVCEQILTERDADPLVRRIGALSPGLTDSALDQAIIRQVSARQTEEVAFLEERRALRETVSAVA